MRPRRWLLALGFVLMVINRVAALVLPYSTKFLIDTVINKHHIEQLRPLVLLVLAATLIQGITSFSLTQLLSKAAQRLIAELRQQVQAHISRLPVAFYDSNKTANLVETMFVYPERMRRNLDLTRGLVFSGQLLLDLAAAGMLREAAYRVVQRHAMEAWENESDFRAAIEADPEIAKVLTREQIAESFSLDRQLRNVDKIFARVFDDHQS